MISIFQQNVIKMNVPINKNAPVVERNEIYIPVDHDIVYTLISDVNGWSEWQSSVSCTIVENELKEGVSFKWEAEQIRFKSKIHTLIDGRAIGWTGSTFGTSAIHNWYIEPIPGGTIVHVEESLEGVLPSLFRRSFSRSLKKGMAFNLQELYWSAVKVSNQRKASHK